MTVLRGARIFDGSGFGAPRNVAFEGGVLVAPELADRSSEVIDASGCFLLPGLVDGHVHLSGPQTQERLAAWGVTTAFDMSSPAPLVAAMRGRTGVTDIRSSIMATTSPASAHAQRMRNIPAAAEANVASAAEADAVVARRVEQGADYLKIVIDLPGFDLETVRALVDAAHARGLRTVAHASRSDAVDLGEAAGVDVLTHVPLDRPIGAEQAARLAAAGTVVVPTLAMMAGIVAATPALPATAYGAARESVRALHAAGVLVLAGTDANETPAAPASPAFGSSLHDELGLLVEAGLSPLEALRSAGSAATDYWGLSDRGRIEPGLRADLLLLRADPMSADPMNADPMNDLAATRRIRGVWIAGERVADIAGADASE